MHLTVTWRIKSIPVLKGDAQFGSTWATSKILKAIEKGSGVKKGQRLCFESAPSVPTKYSLCTVDFPDLNWDDNKLTEEHTQMLYEL